MSAASLKKTQLQSETTTREVGETLSEIQLLEYQQSLRANSQQPFEVSRYYTTASKLTNSVYSNAGGKVMLLKSTD